MAQSESPRKTRRLESHTVSEGDTVFMGINLHGSSDDCDGVTYDRDLYQAGVTGTVVRAPRESTKELMADGTAVMADFAVETADGVRYTWNVDNGYVIGPVDHPDRPDRSDVGKFGGFYEPTDD